MTSKTILALTAAIGIAAAAGFSGLSLGAGEAAPSTSPELVSTYSELATAILANKRAETAVCRAICADAFHAALRELDAAKAVVASDMAAAGGHLEKAATFAGIIATEGDKAVAAVRNRLLEGGHHHHATPEIAKKYDPGYVLIRKTDKQKLLAAAGALGKLAGAVARCEAGAEEIDAARKELSDLYAAATK